jgi:predicted small metal-binding protein
MAKINAKYLAACRNVDKVGVCEYEVEGDSAQKVVDDLHAHEKRNHGEQYGRLSPEEREEFQKKLEKAVREKKSHSKAA